MGFAEYSNFDALSLAELVKKKKVKPAELVEAAIVRIEQHNPRLNAIVFKAYDEARAKATAKLSGAFTGVPMLLKDILGDKKGWPTRRGSRFVPATPSPFDATLVSRFEAAGLIPLGKTNVPEFGLLPFTEPKLYGPARNPWSFAHSTGGSSGGSAAAVAAGIVPLAHANDGGGSIRIPAACCGLVGLKPTRARTPMGPDVGDFAGGLAIDHVVSRTVRDCAAALDATHGPEPGDPYAAPVVTRPFLEESRTPPGRLRIAFTTTNLNGIPLHPECIAAVERTAALLADLGHICEEAAPTVDMNMMTGAFLTVFTAAHAMVIEGFGMMHGRVPTEKDFEGLTWSFYQQGKEIPATQYLISVAMLQMAARQIARFHENYDCWLTSTLGTPPIKIGVIDIQERDPLKGLQPVFDYVPFTPMQNATGQPAISLPLHWTADGLPVGVMFTGRFGDEATLLRLAGQLEEARPWRDRRPPIWD